MNKRIEELVVQAHMHADANYNEGPDEEWWKEYNQKFAELIVRECAEIADDNYIHSQCRGSRDCGLAIRNHFGVDE